MDLSEHVETIHRQFAAAAEAGGDEARELAERLFAPLDAAIRLALQDALSAAADEITCELAPGSVELRLRGRQPEFVVNWAPTSLPDGAGEAGPAVEADAGPIDAGPIDTGPTDTGPTDTGPTNTGDGGTARINLRMPEQLKARVDQAAARQGMSVNSWLVRAASAALERRDRITSSIPGSQAYRGWTR